MWVSRPQQFKEAGNTHVDLHGHRRHGAQRRVPDGVEDEGDDLRGEIERAAVDDDNDCSPTCSSREIRAENVGSLARGEVPHAHDYEHSHYRVRDNLNNEDHRVPSYY